MKKQNPVAQKTQRINTGGGQAVAAASVYSPTGKVMTAGM